MKPQCRGYLLPGLIAAMLAGPAQAADEASMFSLSGFGTLGAVKTSTDDGVFKLSNQPRGARTDWSTEVDSRLGVQVTGKFSPMFSATAQVLVGQTGEGNYRPALEWGFVKAQVTPGLALRAGRMGAPYFAVSDFRHVGYANLWVRPPSDVYNQVASFSFFDGADATYQSTVGAATLTGTLLAGSASSKVTGTPVKLRNIVGLNFTAEFDNGIALRFGHMNTRLTVESKDLAGLVATLATTPWASVGQQLSADNKKASFSGVGVSYDNGSLVLATEFTKRKTESYVPDTTGWFVSAGYRVGKFTPYTFVSKVKVDDANVVNTIPAGLPGAAGALKPGVDGLVAGQHCTQDTQALGVRWDAYRNVAVKGQYERIKPETVGFFGGGRNLAGAKVNVYSMVVDFVF